MNLTSLDPETGAVIFPFDEGRTRGRCRDEDCRAEMVAVKDVVMSDAAGLVVVRRSHWRHKVAPEGTRRCLISDRAKTPWHTDWQMRCTDAPRIEFRHLRGKAVRVADVWTKFEWAIEFQHSVLDAKTAKARETHYRGRVLWVVDATPMSSISGSVDQYRGQFRWSAIRPWIIEAKALVAVDDGITVHLLPPGGLRRYLHRTDLLIPREHVKVLMHDDFATQWINGNLLPLPVPPNTEWAQESAAKAAKSRDRQASDLRLVGNSVRRAAYDEDADTCRYAGNRSKLVYAEGTPETECRIGNWVGTIHLCRKERCISAAGTSGWCWAHGVARDIGFDPRVGTMP